MKIASILSKILMVLIALLYILPGLTKLFGVQMQIDNFKSWGYPDWSRYPIGLAEIGLGIALFFYPKKSHLVYGIYAWTIVAVITHLQAGQAAMVAGPLFYAVLGTLYMMSLKKAGTWK